MTAGQDRHGMIETGKHWVEQMGGNNHDIVKMHWDTREGSRT